MYAFVFEDNIDTPSSRLLKESYNSKNIYFSGSNSKLISKTNSVLKQGYDGVILFVDVSPNNGSTIGVYNSLVAHKKKISRWSSVVIVPIICIEFYIAKMCVKYNYFGSEYIDNDIIRYMVNDFDWDNCPYKNKSLEKVYKIPFSRSNYNKECLINSNSFGRFYTQDCNCCDISKDSLSKKANLFYSTLPVYDVVDEHHDDMLNSFNVDRGEVDLLEFK